jgi:SAM-dependent methyltransferase
MSEWLDTAHVAAYRSDPVPHRSEGEAVLLDLLPRRLARVLDLGCGDGQLTAVIRAARPEAGCVAMDFSPAMLEVARQRFAADPMVEVVQHDLSTALPCTGIFDAVVSSFAIHHLAPTRQRALYAEAHDLLRPGGVLLNLEHVASPTRRLHERFFAVVGRTEDPSNQLVEVGTQLGWLREIGFEDVDCHWKWLELGLLGGSRPGRAAGPG